MSGTSHDAPPAASRDPLQTDEQLMLAFSGGSSASFSELFARYKQPLFGFFR